MMNSYLTLRREASDEFTVQKSRFIGYACPCESEEQALAFLKRIREKHRDARHCCYAYIIGANQGIMRYSDDGEPGGTAGMPMMDVLRGQGLVNCCAVVVRYFGGILLGTGGLVRAYTEGCKIAVQAARRVSMEWTRQELCEVPYSCWDTLQYALRQLPAKLENIEYGAAISFHLLVREKDYETVMKAMMDATSQQMETLPEDSAFLPWDQPGVELE